ncbi:hypothetical protein HYT54_04335 [Candidatus Woesearchaeota archaeon]|nr:hypothetical protein [Candidatus Woesearchaeota archaeon]
MTAIEPLTYDENNFKFPIVIAGPSRVGKHTTEEYLLANWQDLEEGEKFIYRAGGSRPSDVSKGRQILLTMDDVRAKRSRGNIAFEYGNEETALYLVGLNDALRTDKHLIYVAGLPEGARRFIDFFTRIQRGVMSTLLYTNLGVLESRLAESDMTQPEMLNRLNTLKGNLAEFFQDSDQYMVLLETHSPFIHQVMGHTAEAEDFKAREIESESMRLYRIIQRVKQFYTNHFMSNSDVHMAYLDSLVQRLTGNSLKGLQVSLGDGAQVRLDLSEQLEGFLAEGNVIGREAQQAVGNVHVVKSYTSTGRHSILLRGYRAELDDLILELILRKIGDEPTRIKRVDGQDFAVRSRYGYFNSPVEDPGQDGFAQFKDGAIFSLGDQMAMASTHPSLHVGFMYHAADPAKVKLFGFSVDDIDRYVLSQIEMRPNGIPHPTNHNGSSTIRPYAGAPSALYQA